MLIGNLMFIPLLFSLVLSQHLFGHRLTMRATAVTFFVDCFVVAIAIFNVVVVVVDGGDMCHLETTSVVEV